MSDLLEDGPPEGFPEESPAGVPSAPERRRHPARVAALAVAVVLAAFVVVAAVVKGGTKDTAATPLLGQPAPVVQTTTIDGQPFDLATRRGSWVVLNFFASWCDPCKQEAPELVRFSAAQEAQGPGGAELVGVVYNDAEDSIRRFLDDWGDGFDHVVLDADGRSAIGYGVVKIPETWIVDPDGIVRARMISAVSAETLTELGNERSNTIVFPMPMDLLSPLVRKIGAAD